MLACKGSFDSASASLREADAPLRVTRRMAGHVREDTQQSDVAVLAAGVDVDEGQD
jgi:hypothetical protein